VTNRGKKRDEIGDCPEFRETAAKLGSSNRVSSYVGKLVNMRNTVRFRMDVIARDWRQAT
jgi:hypothetical protein